MVDYYAGQYNVAQAAFDRYLATNPPDPSTALYYEGLVLRELDDLPGAISLWDEIIQGDPSSPKSDSAWEQKAYTQWAYQGDYVAAEQTLLDFVTAAPSHPRAAEFLFDAGRVAERDGRLEEAAQIWQRIPTEYPASEYVYRALFATAHLLLPPGELCLCAGSLLAGSILSPPPRLSVQAHTSGQENPRLLRGTQAAAKATWQQATPLDPTGYYSERARDLLNDQAPFTPPQVTDLGFDRQSELRQAELWMRTTFNYPSGTDFSVPGPLANDPRFIRGQELWNLGLQDQAESEFSDLREISGE